MNVHRKNDFAKVSKNLVKYKFKNNNVGSSLNNYIR